MTNEKTLWLIDPSVRSSEPRGLRVAQGDWPGKVRLLRPALVESDRLIVANYNDGDAVIVMGSATSANDSHPWLGELKTWLRPILAGEKRVALLGICFGHQLIGWCAGARVGYVHSDRSKVLGVRQTHLTGCRLFPGEHVLQVAASHCEQLEQVPESYDCIASRDDAVIDGIQHRKLPIFGLQFHAEAGGEFLSRRGAVIANWPESEQKHTQELISEFRRQALLEP